MKKIIFKTLAVVATSTLLYSCSSSNSKKVKVELESKSGSSVTGWVQLEEKDSKVQLSAAIKNAKPGKHAIHIHEKGDCSSSDGKSAGGHWNPDNSAHGKWGNGEHHRGDIGNITVGKDGTGTLELSTDRWCLGCEDTRKNIVGKAIVVHDGEDDFVSQPSGDAGSRVACGEIEMK